MIHGHITAWLLTIILFFVANAMIKGQNKKGQKIVHMIVRVLYIAVLGTGLGLLFSMPELTTLYVVKAVIGLWIISIMEMILVKRVKGKSVNIFWIQFAVALVLVLYLGFKLPMGFNFMA